MIVLKLHVRSHRGSALLRVGPHFMGQVLKAKNFKSVEVPDQLVYGMMINFNKSV